MDIEKLIDRLYTKEQSYDSYTDSEFAHVMDVALTALFTLQTENEKLLDKIEDAQLEGYVKGLGEMSEENEKLRAELEQVKRERDAALNDLNTLRLQSGWKCFACDNADATEGGSRCNGCNYSDGHNYKWRGPQKED